MPSPIRHSSVEDYSHLQSASAGQRFTAFTVDSFLSGGLQALAAALLPGENPLTPLLVLWAPVLYFVLTQFHFGATLGKRLIGLRVVSTRGTSAPSFFSLLGRETVGRLLALLPLGYGYLRIFGDPDKRGWHDTLFGTRVASLGPVPAFSWARLFKHLFASTAAVALLVGAVAYYGTHSGVRLKLIEKGFEKAGFILEGLEGSEREGYRAKRFAGAYGPLELDLQGIYFKPGPGSGKNSTDVESLHVTSGTLTVKMPDEVREARPAEGSKPPLLIELWAGRKQLGVLAKQMFLRPQGENVRISEFVIRGLRIAYSPTEEPIRVERLVLKNFDSDHEAVRVERIFLESDILLADVAGLAFGADRLSMTSPASFTFQKKYSSSMKSPVDVQLKYEVMGGRESLTSWSFGKTLYVASDPQGIRVQAQGFQPQNFFSTPVPFSNVNLRLQAVEFMKLAAPEIAQGHFFYRKKLFTLLPMTTKNLIAAHPSATGAFHLYPLPPLQAAVSNRWFLLVQDKAPPAPLNELLTRLHGADADIGDASFLLGPDSPELRQPASTGK